MFCIDLKEGLLLFLKKIVLFNKTKQNVELRFNHSSKRKKKSSTFPKQGWITTRTDLPFGLFIFKSSLTSHTKLYK